ncbi:MAG: MBL fold metallo-hydrolase [Pirellulales bacterium]|nr:MBL fold metallo-hydrolase [Pirellulales bacterium]
MDEIRNENRTGCQATGRSDRFAEPVEEQFAAVVEEVAPRILRLSEPMGKRLLNCYLIEDAKGAILFDAGLPGSVSRRLEIGQLSGPIGRLIVSHADADHLGDVANLKNRYANLRVACHRLERKRCENHDLLVGERYDHARKRFGFGYPESVLTALRDACGDDFEVDDTWEAGDCLTGGGLRWQVLYLPGHSAGHLGLWSEQEGILLGGDAVLGLGPPGVGGKPSMPGTHEDIPAYLNTIDELGRLDVRLALLGHWPPLGAGEFGKLLEQSREHVGRDLAVVREAIQLRSRWTFAEMLARLNEKFSSWEVDEDAHYSYALAGYLRFLESCGEVRITEDGTIAV